MIEELEKIYGWFAKHIAETDEEEAIWVANPANPASPLNHPIEPLLVILFISLLFPVTSFAYSGRHHRNWDRPPVVVPPPVVQPPSSQVKAIDTMNTITDPNWFVKAYNQGYRLLIISSVDWGSCNPWWNTQNELKMALNAGLKIAVYTRDPNCWSQGIASTGIYKSQLQFFAIDIESIPGTPVTRAMVNGITALGVRPIIYSGSGMWPQIMGSQNFSDLPLWDTDTSQPKFNPYGGWTNRVGYQSQFEYTLNGINVDLNTFDSSFLK